MGDRVLHGLLPGDSSSVFLFSSSEYDERWAKAELVTAELIGRIQPSKTSEELRKAVINYVERVIERDLDCKVFAFGSVPLKTYLPNGDIDLTAFSTFHHLNDTWANDLCTILENEERSHNAGFQVKEVKCIHAEVPVVKCLVENIIVDISFNQLGGLSTLCFLERVDRLIGHDHLFKRSIILVKAWCFYESRILGAHHGLLSTYALETLVLYIFHVFHGSLRGPLEVLFRFLEFFSKFDWNQYCLSLSGPIPLVSLHNITDLPQKQCDQFLLSKAFLDTCRQEYSVSPVSLGTQGKAFSQKYMNVIDPLRSSNNLGRSVNKGNFVRIHSAFAYGAGQLEKLFQSPQEHLAENLVAFFQNTEKHCRRRHPESPVLGLKHFQVQFDALSCGDKDRSKYSSNQMNDLRKCTVATMSTNPRCDLTSTEASIVPNGFPAICDSDESDSIWSTAEGERDGHKTSSKTLEDKIECAAVAKMQRLQNGSEELQPSVLWSDRFLDDRDTGSNHGDVSGRNLAKLVGLGARCPLHVRERESQEQQPEESIQETRSIMGKQLDHNHHLTNCNNRCFDDTGSNHGDVSGRNLVKLVGLGARCPLHVRERESQEQQPEESIQETRSIMGKQLDHNHPLTNCNNRCFDDKGDCATDPQKSEVGECELSEVRDTEADILRGDFAIHLQNLEAGRCFQRLHLHGPLSSAVSSLPHTRYTEEGSTWEGPGRPGTLTTSLSMQISGRRNGVLPPSALHEAHFQNSCALRSSIYADGLPKFHKGTGTFFPNVNPGFDRDRRLTSMARGQRGPSSLDVRDQFNHNGAPPCRTRYSGQKRRDGFHKSRNKVEKDKMELKFGASDWDILKEDSIHAALPSGNSKAFQIGKVEFGSFGPVGYLVGGFQSSPFEQENVELALQNQHSAHDGEHSRLSETVANVGNHVGHHQSLSEGSYQLKDEDFPPLKFCTQRERSSVFASQKS